MISLATETDRTLFFDFLPLDLGTVRGFKTRLHLYTVPGQVFYEASRKLILKGADGVVFVADSQEERLDANLETLENLREHLKEHNLDFATIPYVLQLNKRDLPGILPVDELTKKLQEKGEPIIEAVAVTVRAFSRRFAMWRSWSSRNFARVRKTIAKFDLEFFGRRGTARGALRRSRYFFGAAACWKLAIAAASVSNVGITSINRVTFSAS